MLFSHITALDENFDVVEGAYVGVQGDTVTYFDTVPPADTAVYGEVYDGTGKLLLPAFYNMHSHLPMCLMRGYAENLPLMEWLNNRIFPFEGLLTPEDQYWATLLGVAEMLRYGIASTTEMYLCQSSQGKAFLDSGVKANFCQNVVCFDDGAFKDSPAYTMAIACQKDFHGAGNGRLRTEFCIHAEYTNTERSIRGVAEAAAENHSSVHVHVAETAGEVQGCKDRHQGRTPVKFLHDCGLFAVPATAAHCVWLTDEDIAILAADGVTVATCPKSNLKLASGIAPVAKLLAAGVNVAIGTDSVSSNNNLNMVEEMRFFNLLQKGVTSNPQAITPKQTLYAATRAGALGQQRPDCGLVKVGFKADLAVMDISSPVMKPCYDALNNLVYSASGSDVALTMVDGNVLYRDGAYATLDIEQIVAHVEASRQRILGQLSAK